VSAAGPERWPGKYAAKPLLGYVMDTRLAEAFPDMSSVCLTSPWDAWWVCYRAGLPLSELAPGISFRETTCRSCADWAMRLSSAVPPGHPGAAPMACDCLLRWASEMRAPGLRVTWPPISLSFALIKPGAPAMRIASLLSPACEILASRKLTLTTTDTRRMYPEAYGSDYVRARDAYMTAGPVHILVMRARADGIDLLGGVKARIRSILGGDVLRNHLHMPDNPGETLADIAQFAGHKELAQLYRRYERDHNARRLAFYRAALGIGPPGADRLTAVG
jgi:hypothetical protein